MPINETESHWFLARFEIETGLVTFYDSGQVFVDALTDFYFQVMECLQVRVNIRLIKVYTLHCLNPYYTLPQTQLPEVLSQAQVFQKKGIDPSTYTITFYHPDKIPKQSGIFGDCGIWVCIFLYRLAYGMSLDVEDPVQAALAYREQMTDFFFKHRVCV